MQHTVRTIWNARATAEQRVLLATLRAALDPDLLPVQVDPANGWEGLAMLAERHRVLPLLVAGSADVPADVRERARDAAIRSMMLAGELNQILELLERAGVTAIPYKGPALAIQLYGNAALRQGGDLDLLITPDDLMPARAALMAAGYQPLPEPPGYRLDARHLRRYHEYSLVHPKRPFRCELQWSAMETPYTFPPLPTMQRWRRDAETIRIAGRSVPMLNREATALILAVHGAKHLWERLAWVADIAVLMRQSVDWEAAQAEARALGVERLLLLSLHLAAELLEVPLPMTITARSQHVIDRLAAQALDFLLREHVDHDAAPAARNLFLIGGLDRVSDRLLVGVRFAPRLLQPVQLYRRHGLKPLQHILGPRFGGRADVAVGERRAP